MEEEYTRVSLTSKVANVLMGLAAALIVKAKVRLQ